MNNAQTYEPTEAVRPRVARRPRTPVDPRIEALWFTYKAEGDRHDRDRLLLHYASLVRSVAGRVGSNLPSSVDQDDLISYGTLGLIDAIEKFEPERGLKFETYAVSRIRGAIIDELRALDWVPRSVRTKVRDVERAFVALETELSRTPSEAEIAERLAVTVADLRQVFNQASSSTIVALDDLMHRGGDGDDAAVTLGDRLVDHRIEQPGDRLEDEESRRALSQAVSGLNERDRIVISLYYFENLTLAEIGQVLGVTESRVCQLHTKATEALKDRLAPLLAEAA